VERWLRPESFLLRRLPGLVFGGLVGLWAVLMLVAQLAKKG
jgi:hypothetical protein